MSWFDKLVQSREIREAVEMAEDKGFAEEINQAAEAAEAAEKASREMKRETERSNYEKSVERFGKGSQEIYDALPSAREKLNCPKCRTATLERRIIAARLLINGPSFEALEVKCLHCGHEYLERVADDKGMLTYDEVRDYMRKHYRDQRARLARGPREYLPF